MGTFIFSEKSCPKFYYLTQSRKKRQGLIWQFLSSPICCTLFPQLKADFLGRPFRRCHQLTNSRHEGSNRLIMGFNFAFQPCQFMGQCLMGRKYFTESNESPDNKNANLGSPLRIENGGQRQGDFNEFLTEGVIQVISCRFST
jgi:hypothetical protein